jgi:hypothetical protein
MSVQELDGPRLIAVDAGRIDARGPSPEPSVTAGGQLIAVARRVRSGGPDTWCVRVLGGQAPRFIESEQATRAFMASLGGAR